MDKNRFIKAQKNVAKNVEQELLNQNKETHWIWFVFPQLKGLGFSKESQFYALENLQDAKEFYNNKYLRLNMTKFLGILLNYDENVDIKQVLGLIDTEKLHSSMTLFYLATKKVIFKNIIDKFFNGLLDNKTVLLLKSK